MNFKTFDPEQLDLSKLDSSDSKKRKEIKLLLLNLIKEGESVIKKTESKLPTVLKEFDIFTTPQRKLHLKSLKIEKIGESSSSAINKTVVQTKSATVVSDECKKIQKKLQLRGLQIEKVGAKPISSIVKPTTVVAKIEKVGAKPISSIVKQPTVVATTEIKLTTKKEPIKGVKIQFKSSNVTTTPSGKGIQPKLQLSGLQIEEENSIVTPPIVKKYERKRKLEDTSIINNDTKNQNQMIINVISDPGVKCIICKKIFKNLKLLGEHSKEYCDHRNIIYKNIDDNSQKTETILPFEHIVIKSEFTEDVEPKVLKKIPFKENVKKLENGKFLCLKCKFISKNNHSAFSHLLKHLNDPPQKPEIKKVCIKTPVTATITSTPVVVKKLPIIKLQKNSQSNGFDDSIILNTPAPSSKFHQCDQCPKAFTTVLLLFGHKQRMHKREEIEEDSDEASETEFHGFPEEFCNTIFDTVIEAVPKNMEVKLDEWLDTDSHNFIPPPKKFKKSNRVQKQIKIKFARGIKHFKCIICTDGFAKQFELNNHILKEHDSVPTFKCDICFKILLSQSSLDTHKTLMHSKNLKKFACDKCENVTFHKQELLDDHILFKHSHNCTQCDIRPFKDKRLLDNHVFKHHAGENCNKCHICGKLFKEFHHIKRHIQSVHENYRPKTCNICGKNFKDIDMSKHMRTHSDERPFECDLCDSKFKFNQDLGVHKRLHTGERPYQCTICQMKFIASTNLNKHMKSRHPVNPDSLNDLLN